MKVSALFGVIILTLVSCSKNEALKIKSKDFSVGGGVSSNSSSPLGDSLSPDATTPTFSVTLTTSSGIRGSTTVSAGTSMTLNIATVGASSCQILKDGLVAGNQTSGTLSVGPVDRSTSYIAVCMNSSGSTTTDQLDITVSGTGGGGGAGGGAGQLQANIYTGTVATTAKNVTSGTSIPIQWTSTNATSCQVTNSAGTILSNATNYLIGLDSGPITTSEIFTLTCIGTGGVSTNATLAVSVLGGSVGGPGGGPVAATLNILANNQENPLSIAAGAKVLLKWTSAGMSYCEVRTNSGSIVETGKENQGFMTAPVMANETFKLQCTGLDGKAYTDSVQVNVLVKPTADLRVNNSNGPLTVPFGTQVMVQWASTGADTCSAKAGEKEIGTAAQEGMGLAQEPLYQTVVFTLTCTGPGGTSLPDSVTVNVSAPTNHIVFVSSKTFEGNLGGLTGADQKCKDMAAAANLRAARPWKAILSDDSQDLRSRLGLTLPVVDTMGRTIFSRGNEMYDDKDGDMSAAIKYDENREEVDSSHGNVWSGSVYYGTKFSPYNCQNWRTDSASYVGAVGCSQEKSFGWLYETISACDRSHHIYCISY